MDSGCQKTQDRIAQLITAKADPARDPAVAEHIGACPTCAEYLRAMQADGDMLAQLADSLQPVVTRIEKNTERQISESPARQVHRPASLWRTIMARRKTQIVAAALFILAIALAAVVLNNSATPAYAVDQTTQAIKKIKTVYMAGEFYRQGQFECWLKFDGNPDRPTHAWLGLTGHNLCKICSPDGVFGLNRRTNRVHFARRDERNKDWIIKFGRLFTDAVRKANTSDKIKIYRETDAKTGEETIVVHITTKQRAREFLIDRETKLPTRLTTVREDAPMEMMRKTLAVKHLTEIRYNQEPPAGIFDMPADAQVVEQEVDCLVDPDSGLVADGMTREEACLAIVNQACQAMIDLDTPKLESLALSFRLWPDQLWERAKQMKATGQWAQGYEITGEPYKEGDYWYVPAEIKLPGDKTEVQTAMIGFYDFGGVTHCFCIGSKEEGVVD